MRMTATQNRQLFFCFKTASSGTYRLVHHRTSGTAMPAGCFRWWRPMLREVIPRRKGRRFSPTHSTGRWRGKHHVQGGRRFCPGTGIFYPYRDQWFFRKRRRGGWGGRIPQSTRFHRGCSSRRRLLPPDGERPAGWRGRFRIARRGLDVDCWRAWTGGTEAQPGEEAQRFMQDAISLEHMQDFFAVAAMIAVLFGKWRTH